MSELRHDPIQKQWVIIALERTKRPFDFAAKEEENKPTFCPFDEGNEDKTPSEIFSIRKNCLERDKPGWSVRVVPNKYPALSKEGEVSIQNQGLYGTMNGVGAHEVIIETTDHNLNIPDMTVEHLEKVIGVYQIRLRALGNDPRFRYVLVFKNYGKTAGASLSHPHTQIIATPIIPRTVEIELDSAREYYTRQKQCLFCKIIQQEIEAEKRVIKINDDFIAIAPYASRFPFEIFIAPIKHHHDFSQTLPYDLRQLAIMLKEIMLRLRESLKDPSYNFVFHTSPPANTEQQKLSNWQTLKNSFHWHIEILPRLTTIAGFEWGTGFYINPTPPEVAAEYLREAKI